MLYFFLASRNRGKQNKTQKSSGSIRSTHQKAFSSVQSDHRLLHAPLGPLHQQSGVALVGVHQVGKRLLVPEKVIDENSSVLLPQTQGLVPSTL